MRATIIKLHLFVAAFFAPILLMVAVSGGLYLIGSKGATRAHHPHGAGNGLSSMKRPPISRPKSRPC